MIEIPQINPTAEEKPLDFKKMMSDAFVDVDKQIIRQPIAISMGTHNYKGNIYPTPFGSYGDFSCIVGASKSKKTYLKSLLMSAYIGGKANLYTGEIKGHDTQNKYVLEFDTEQSKFHCQRVFKRVIEMVGAKPDYYVPFSIRGFSVQERLDFIEYVLLESEYKGKIGLVSIDGVADLVTHINDETQSYHVAQKLLEWSEKSNAHIITVMHRNFGSEKPTGHLGSAVLKKAETVVFTEKDDDNVLVTPEYTRNLPFDAFGFGVNQEWLPYVLGFEYEPQPPRDYSEPIEKTPENDLTKYLKSNDEIPF